MAGSAFLVDRVRRISCEAAGLQRVDDVASAGEFAAL